MKKFFLFSFIIFTSFLFLDSPISFAAYEKTNGDIESRVVDKIVAKINDDIIMASELNQRIFMAKKQLAPGEVSTLSDEDLKGKVLAMMIDMNLQLQIAKRAKLEISEEELDKSIENIAQGNSLSVQKFASLLRKEGVDINDFRKHIREQMLISRVQQEAVARKVTVSDDEVDELLRERNANLYVSSDDRNKVRLEIYQRKFKDALVTWLEELRANSYVKIIENE